MRSSPRPGQDRSDEETIHGFKRSKAQNGKIRTRNWKQEPSLVDSRTKMHTLNSPPCCGPGPGSKLVSQGSAHNALKLCDFLKSTATKQRLHYMPSCLQIYGSSTRHGAGSEGTDQESCAPPLARSIVAGLPYRQVSSKTVTVSFAVIMFVGTSCPILPHLC